jgi:2-polyprenyl-6-methoxyphenol hydroxylase-like FAD-dependent oxidoreductase
MIPPCEVAIVGAGPVGLLLALALTELGVTVCVFERGASARHDPRAAIVWPRAAEVLRSVGAIAHFEARACRLRRASFAVNGRHVGTMALGNLASDHPFPLMIEQHETERILAGLLVERGVSVHWGHDLEAFVLRDDGVSLTLASASGRVRVECGWMVGCDGARSTVRKRLGIAFEGAPRRGLECLQVNAVPTWQHPDDRETGYFFVVPGRTLLACPLPTGGYRFVCFTTDGGEALRAGEPTLDELHAVVRGATREEVSLVPCAPRWFNRARFQDRIAASLVCGRVILAGDAAHVWAPIGGHGMNAGLRGAHNLAWKLAAVVRKESPSALLDTYNDEQRAAARAVIEGITRMKTEEPSPAWLVGLLGWIFPYALRWVGRVPQVEARLTELDAHHRGSPLSCGSGPRTTLRAGDRVPDVPVRTATGRTHVHALLGLRQWTIFAGTAAEDSPEVARLRRLVSRYRARVCVVAAEGDGPDAVSALGGVGRVLLIRPDDHVAMVARRGDDEPLARHLDTWLMRAA